MFYEYTFDENYMQIKFCIHIYNHWPVVNMSKEREILYIFPFNKHKFNYRIKLTEILALK